MWLFIYFGLDKWLKGNLVIIEEFRKDVRNDDNDISNKNYKF